MIGFTGDREPVALLAASSPLCPLGLGCFPAPTTDAELRLPRSGSRDKSCKTSVCELLSGLGQLRPPTRDTGPSEPCQGPQRPCALSTLCCGSSVVALKGSLAIQSSSSSKMIIQIGNPPRHKITCLLSPSLSQGSGVQEHRGECAPHLCIHLSHGQDRD